MSLIEFKIYLVNTYWAGQKAKRWGEGWTTHFFRDFMKEGNLQT